MLLSLSVCFFFSWVQAFCLGIQLLHWHQPASTVLIKLLWLLFNSFSCKSGNGLQYIVIIQWARISDFRNPKGCSDFSSTVYMLNYMNLSKVRFIRWHHSNWHRPFFFFTMQISVVLEILHLYVHCLWNPWICVFCTYFFNLVLGLKLADGFFVI